MINTQFKRINLLICGATGFIGRNLLIFYSNNYNYNVTATYHITPPFYAPNVNWILCDLRIESEVINTINGFDIIIQAAATTSGINDITNNPEIHVTDNIIMNSLIFKYSCLFNVKHLIFFSCSIMLNSNLLPQDESNFNSDLNINSNYFAAGWTKFYLEKMCEFFSSISQTKFTAIRHSNIYGPFDKFDLERSHVCGASITKVMKATNEITIWGSGNEIRDLLYIDDLINLVNKVISLQNSKFDLINCGSGYGVSINELVKIIIKVANKDLIIKHDITKPTIGHSIILDINKAKINYLWEPQIELSNGLNKTVDWWIKQNLNAT